MAFAEASGLRPAATAHHRSERRRLSIARFRRLADFRDRANSGSWRVAKLANEPRATHESGAVAGEAREAPQHSTGRVEENRFRCCRRRPTSGSAKTIGDEVQIPSNRVVGYAPNGLTR
jgi:hypothetical protein